MIEKWVWLEREGPLEAIKESISIQSIQVYKGEKSDNASCPPKFEGHMPENLTANKSKVYVQKFSSRLVSMSVGQWLNHWAWANP